jgi:Protein of unknown function (DUF3151)
VLSARQPERHPKHAVSPGTSSSAGAQHRAHFLTALQNGGFAESHEPVPWSHCLNQGFLRALAALSRAAAEIGEDVEARRCRDFIDECDPAAAGALGLE